MKKTAAICLALAAASAFASQKAQPNEADAWEPLSATWSMLPSSVGRITLGDTQYVVARVKSTGPDETGEAAGEFYASLQLVYCRAKRAAMLMTNASGSKSEVLHFTMNTSTGAAVLARRMCARAAAR